MPTAKQIEANRRNAQKSTGPRTSAGKRTSSLNAYTHGLTSQTLVMTAEQAEAYERFTDAIVQDLRPVGAMETQIARSIADTEWRINRAAAIENNIFASEESNQETCAARQAAARGVEPSWTDRGRALANVHSFVDRPERFATGSSTRHRSGSRASALCCASKSLRAIPAFRSEMAPGR